MLLPLLSIDPPGCFNIGGLLALRVWPVGNVVGFPAATGRSLVAPLALLDPENYADIYFLPDSGSFDEPQATNEQGDYYKAKLQVIAPRDSPDLAEAVARLTGGRYLAAYRDGNGYTKLIATPEWPLRFSADLETGRKSTDRNGYPLTFSADQPDRAFFYPDWELPPPPVGRAWSVRFGPGFR